MVNHRSLIKSLGYATEGIIYAYKENQNIRIHFFAAIIASVVSIMLGVTHLEMVVIALTILIAICAEMVNTAIEKMTDLITKEHRLEAKIAKDVSAGMVLITAIGSVVVGIIIFTPYILRLIIH